MKNDNEYIELTSVKAIWPHLHKPSEMSGRFEITLIELDKGAVKTLESAGLTVRDGKDKTPEPKPEMGRYITAKAKPYDNGESPVTVVDSARSPVDNLEIIGNDSIVNIHIKAFDWTFKSKSGRGCGLQALQVVTLVERTDGSSSFKEVEGGYVAPAVAVGSGEDNVPF